MSQHHPPVEVRRAALGAYVVSAGYLLLAILAVLSREAAIVAARERETNLDDTEIVAAVNGVVLITSVIGGTVGLAGIVSAINFTRGRRWARLSATVTIAIALLFSLLGLLGSSGLGLALHTVVIVSGAAALVLLYRRPANEFFAGALPT